MTTGAIAQLGRSCRYHDHGSVAEISTWVLPAFDRTVTPLVCTRRSLGKPGEVRRLILSGGVALACQDAAVAPTTSVRGPNNEPEDHDGDQDAHGYAGDSSVTVALAEPSACLTPAARVYIKLR